MRPNPSDAPPLLDVRPAAAFERAHRPGAVNIPLEELEQRVHELPPRGEPFALYDEQSHRVAQAEARLAARGHRIVDRQSGPILGAVETGPARTRLWRPHDFLVEALNAIDARGGAGEAGAALDLACGMGRDAVYLAERGWRTTACDVLPDALARCDDLAARCGVAVQTLLRDLEVAPALGAECYDVIVVFNFLHRPLMREVARAVRRGGYVVYETFVDPQSERFGKPRRPAHVLRRGELAAFFPGWERLIAREGLAGDRRIAASLLARKAIADQPSS